MKPFAIAVLAVLAAVPASASDEQVRVVFHPTVALADGWYAAGWIIGNAKTDSPDNLNLLGGVGYRTPRWSTELLLHRQFSNTGNQWYLGTRSMAKFGSRVSVYHEFGPFLDRLALYQLTSVEYRVRGKLNAGGEMESVYRRGTDALGGGPRVSHPLFKSAHFSGVAAASYQFRRGPDAVRLWLIINPSF